MRYNPNPATDAWTVQTNASNSNSKTRYNYSSDTIFFADFIKESISAGNLRDYLKSNFNDIKAIITATLINPKHFNLEIGDIVQFDNSDMPMDVFGVVWTNYYFKVSENRWRNPKEKQMTFIQVSPK